MVVGETEKIYSIDNNPEILRKLIITVKEKRLNNVGIVDNLNQTQMLVFDNSVDVILLYDVLYLVEIENECLVSFFVF
jgi:hypothetical protein